jgi:hypothetical protein
MDKFWKIVFIIAVLVAAYATWEKRNSDHQQRSRVRQLAALLKREDFQVNTPPEVMQQNFFKLLAMLHVLDRPERGHFLAFSQPRDTRWYLDEAAALNEFDEAEARLIADSIQEAMAECATTGVFEDPGNLEVMEQGKPATLVKGPFAGEKFRIGFRVTPVAAAEVLNHPANFVLLPATVWALQPDKLGQTSMSFVHDLRDAHLLEPAAVRRIDEAWKAAQKNN